MRPTDLLDLIRRACEGTAAEGLAPRWSSYRGPMCTGTCPIYTGGARGGAAIVMEPCEPAVEALARLVVSQAAEVDRLTEDLALSERGRLLAEEGRDLLHRERIGEVWLWTGNPTEDEVESLSCPVLMPAGEVRRLVRECYEARAEAARFRSESEELDRDPYALINKRNAERAEARKAMRLAEDADRVLFEGYVVDLAGTVYVDLRRPGESGRVTRVARNDPLMGEARAAALEAAVKDFRAWEKRARDRAAPTTTPQEG